MRAEYDMNAKALYIYVKEGEPEHLTTVQVNDSHYTDYDQEGNVIGHEFLLSEPLVSHL